MATRKKTITTSQKPTHYVGIGASAGGLEAIELFFKNMSPRSNLAFIVVQHLSPDYKSLMVELLSKRTEMPVHRAEEGIDVLANNIYLIPPKKNLTIFHGKLLLNDKEINQGINLPIDIFLKSLAEDQAERSIAIILSGTGSDGTRGVRVIKELGGMVMVQDEQSAKFDGMPRAAISTGLADIILSPDKMPKQLLAYVAHPYISGEKQSDSLLKDPDALTRLFAQLRDKTKADFTYYKPSTITRRIERRMSVNQISDFDNYVEYLQNYPGEVTALYRDLLIGVTNFFRDPEAMQEIEKKWLPELLLRCKNREIRFWVAGCSTGEEAYTLAILAKEAMEKLAISRDIKVFATDIDKDAVASASTGIYPESIAGDLDPKIVAKYFYHKEDKLQIARHLREMVVFAQHNVIRDPPFTNIDMVSCRNLLIYLQPVLQQKVFEMFNFSLNPDGLLFLGSSESVGEMEDCFAVLHQKHKIFRSTGKPQSLEKNILNKMPREKRYPPHQSYTYSGRNRRVTDHDGDRIIKQYLEVAVKDYLPLSVITNEQLEIVHIVGDTEGYFKLPSGPAGYSITQMAVKELSIPLSTGIQKVFRTGEPLNYRNIRLQRSQEDEILSIRIIPLALSKGHDPLVTVFFEKTDNRPSVSSDDVTSYNLGEEAQQRIADLEHELQFARENLQATIEELETSNEELQATNEELLSSNEELQSTNEELQSTNEELYTVNAEHQNKIIELTELNNDVDNLLTNSRIGTLLLDENLEVRKFSPEIRNVFHIMEKDIGRPISHIAHRLTNIDPTEKIKKVQQTNQMIEQEVQASSGRYYLARFMPYAIGPSAYSGILATFIDITETKAIIDNLTHSRQTNLDISEYMPAGLFIYQQNDKGELLLEKSNPEAERMTGISITKWGEKRFEEIWPSAQDGFIEKLHTVMATGETCYLDDYTYTDNHLEGTYRIHIFRLPEKRLAISFEDTTKQQCMSRDLKESEHKYRTLFETMAQGVVYQDRDGKIISANPAAEKILGLSSEQMHGIDSMDPRWKAINEDGSMLPGEKHPAMVALSTNRPVFGFIMGIYSPAFSENRWILVNSSPQFHNNEKQPYQVHTTFEDITNRYNLLIASNKTDS